MIGAGARWLEGNLVAVTLASAALALVLPGLEHVPGWAVLPLVGVLAYLSCARVSASEIRAIRPLRALGFYAARFVALPFALYAGALAAVPDYADAVFLLALAPAAASAVAWSGLWGGNTALALGYGVVSNLAAPVVVPAALAAVGHAGVGGEDGQLLEMSATLAAVVLLPAALYFGATRPFPRAVAAVRAGAGPVATLIMGLFLILVVGPQRDSLLADPWFACGAVAVTGATIALLAAFGWAFPAPEGWPERVAHVVSSGLMNNGLMIGLAAVYFPGPVALALIISEVPWMAALVALKRLCARPATLPG